MAPQTPTTQHIVVDGVRVTYDDLTFKEQLTVRDYCRQTSGDELAQPGSVTWAEFLPALVTVVKQRTSPNFTLEQALTLKWSDVTADDDDPADDEDSQDPTPAPDGA